MCLYIPKICSKSRHHPPWFDSSILHHLNLLRTLRRKQKIRPSPASKRKVVNLEQHVHSLISQAKSNYESALLTNHSFSISKVFKYVCYITGQNDLPSTLHLDKTSAVTDSDKANLFNLHFHSVFTTSSFPCPDSNYLTSIYPTISNISISEDEVY